MSDFTPDWDAIAFDFACDVDGVPPERWRAVLNDYMQRFPDHAAELVDFATMLFLVDAVD